MLLQTLLRFWHRIVSSPCGMTCDEDRPGRSRGAFTIESMAQTLISLEHGQPKGRILEAVRPLRLWHLLSLDAPTVAVAWSLGFANAARVQLPAWVPVLLALVTWAVYISDRLLDAQSAFRFEQIQHLRTRHHYHWQHRRVFIALALAVACSAVWIVVSFMPSGARERNMLLALASAIYFSSVHAPTGRRRLLPKELLVAILFTLGCALPVIGRSTAISPAFVAACVFFAGLAWLNCHAIERWESMGPSCLAPRIRFAASLLTASGLLGAIALLVVDSRESALIGAGAASAALLGLLDVFRGRMTPLTLRSAADLVLLTPLVLLLR